MSLGHPSYPRPKGTRNHSMAEKRGYVEIGETGPRKTRVAWSKLDRLNPNPDRGLSYSVVRPIEHDVIESLFQKGGLERRKGMNPRPYPSDLTSQQWAVLKPLLPPARTGGRPRRTEMRSVVNAIFYRNRMAVSGERCPTIFPHGGPSTTTLRRGNETELGRPSMMPSDVESGSEPVGSQPPVPAVSIARPSR